MNIKNFKLEVFHSSRLEKSEMIDTFTFTKTSELRDYLSSDKIGNYCYVLYLGERSTVIMCYDDITADTIVSSFELCSGKDT